MAAMQSKNRNIKEYSHEQSRTLSHRAGSQRRISRGSALTSFAYEPKTAEANADVLNTLGLFMGTENGYELDKPLTRMEALIMLIRLSGNEIDALYSSDEYKTPFTDTPDWEKADRYLGYAYEKGLTRVSAIRF